MVFFNEASARLADPYYDPPFFSFTRNHVET